MAIPRQIHLVLPPRFGHGGARRGAGRPRTKGDGVPHSARPRLSRHHPVHVTLRAVDGSPNLRKGLAWAAVRRALEASAARDSCRVVHFSVQSNHLHLLVEADDRVALSRGLQGFAIRLARGVNRACARAGRLWRDRFHARALRTPREVRNCLCYVLQTGGGTRTSRAASSRRDGSTTGPPGGVSTDGPTRRTTAGSRYRSWPLPA